MDNGCKWQVAVAGLTFSPDGALAYITNTAGTMLRAVNTATNTLARFITVGSPTAGVAVSPDDTHVDVNAVHHAIPSTSITGRVAGSLERLRYDAP